MSGNEHGQGQTKLQPREMTAKKKRAPVRQLELPVAAPASASSGQSEVMTPALTGEDADNGPANVVAEAVAVEAARPFSPDQIQSALHRRMDVSFLEYASYVIRDRAIPALADGLKPVQRRILWALHEKDDGRFIKVANVVGHCMQYHPHGDASIGEALVVLANKRYLIEGQGNFGNLFTGDPPAAPRYIECRLTPLAREVLFHDDLTPFVPSYDGRNREPVALPAKVPLLLMLGTEGIAVGLSCRILPHNFGELLRAQIAILKQQPFKVLPDFPTGGLMDAREYRDGRGSVQVRARIKVKDESTVVIKDIPPTTTTESLVGSIEDAARKGKIKVKSIQDYTAEEVEIEVRAPQGVAAEQLMDALYAFTGCEVTITSRIVAIRDHRPVEMTVSEVLRENTDQLLVLLRRELELREHRLEEDLHFRTLERIFIEERLYQRIEKCRTQEAVVEAVRTGLEPFRSQVKRDITDADIDRLLAVRIRRISLFDIEQHRSETEKVKAELVEVRGHLKRLVPYAIRLLEGLLEKYDGQFPRRTRSSRHDEIDAREVAFKAFKVAYDRETGYLGHKVNGDEFKLDCTKFDKLLVLHRDGHYRLVELPERLFVGSDLVYCGLPDRDRVVTLVYADRDAAYLKRFTFGGMILNREYHCTLPKSRILFFALDTPEQLYFRYKPAPYQRINQQTCRPERLEVRGPKARGRQVSIKEVAAVGARPPRGWDPEAPITELQF